MPTPNYSSLAQQFKAWLSTQLPEVTSNTKEVKVQDRRSSTIARLPFASTSFPVSRTTTSRQG